MKEKLRDSNPKINQNFQNLNADTIANANNLETHKTSTTAHASENITYSGKVPGSNVRDAIDNVNGRISEIVAQAGDDNTEIVDARGGYTTLGDRLNNTDEKLADNATNLYQRAINVKFPPPPLVGAKGDGITDDQPAIQAIIDYANTNNFNIYIPEGTYRLNNTLKRKGKVSICGAGMNHTTLKYFNSSGVVIDTVNESLHGVIIEKFTITKDASVTGQVTGILGGSSIELYNSAAGVFRDIKFMNLQNGILGNGEPSGVGIFDCAFERCWFNSCFNGLDHYGSGNITLACRFDYSSGSGLVLSYLNIESMAGNIDINSEYIANATDITVPNSSGIRPCSFYNSWFEQSKNGIIVIPNMQTRVMSMTFENCMLSTNFTSNLMSFFGAEGSISINNCTLYQTNSSYGKTIIAPSTNGTLRVENCIGYNADGSVFKPPKGNVFNGIPPAYYGENGDYAIDATNNRVYFKIGDAWTKYIALS